jgi:hypothetical protein
MKTVDGYITTIMIAKKFCIPKKFAGQRFIFARNEMMSEGS